MEYRELTPFQQEQVRDLRQRVRNSYFMSAVFGVITVFCVFAMNYLQATFLITGFASMAFFANARWCLDEIDCIMGRRNGNFYHH